MSRESVDEVRGDGTIYNGFDYKLQVWVGDGLVDACGGGSDNARRYAGYPVATVPGHEVRDLFAGVTVGRCSGCDGGHVLRDGKCWNCVHGVACDSIGAHS